MNEELQSQDDKLVRIEGRTDHTLGGLRDVQTSIRQDHNIRNKQGR